MTGTLWLTLGEASRILGVDPDTLRRWADHGKIDVLKTPGGHRRFLRSSIEGMLPRPRQPARQSLTAMGEPPDRIAAEFLKRVRSDMAEQDWRARFDEVSLRWYRERGNVARRRALEARQAASLFEEADQALDTVILALIDGHRAA